MKVGVSLVPMDELTSGSRPEVTTLRAVAEVALAGIALNFTYANSAAG